MTATTLSGLVGVAALVLPFTTSGASPVDGEPAGPESSDTSLVTVTTEGDGDVTEAVDGTVTEVEKAVKDLGLVPEGVLPPSEDTTTTTTTTTVPDSENSDENSGQNNEQQNPDEGVEQADEEDAATEEAESEPSPRMQAVLVKLRALDGPPSSPPVVDPTLVSWVQPVLDYVDVPRGPRSSRELVDVLQAAGATQQQIGEILSPFPVAGPASYSNDWGAPRHGPGPIVRGHEGTDVFAPRGTPVVAAFGGVVTRMGRDTAIGGNSVSLTLPGGDYLYYAHLDGFAPGLREGVRVEPADVLGSVGSTGNAVGTPPHLHFEIHPAGSGAVPPLPYLDAWLAQARAETQAFLDSGSVSQPAFGPGTGQAGGEWLPPLSASPAAAKDSASNVPSMVAGWLLILGVGAAVALRRRRVFEGAWYRLRGMVPWTWHRAVTQPHRPDVLEVLLAYRTDPPASEVADSEPEPVEVREGKDEEVLAGVGGG